MILQCDPHNGLGDLYRDHCHDVTSVNHKAAPVFYNLLPFVLPSPFREPL
ncbi:rCG44251 [Rattus norvegicus]|uniref:RCG44251 n=1 Tax=Rattus norvegicus TaxID=10116 RepID=A6KU65_RAT|nr:rCG44251 [Rattus norvegicus]